MKKLTIICAVSLVGAASAFAQGKVNFGWGAPLTTAITIGGSPVVGANNIVAQLYFNNGTEFKPMFTDAANTTVAAPKDIGTPIPGGPGTATVQYTDAATYTLNTTGTFKLVAWDKTYGATLAALYANAAAVGVAMYGESTFTKLMVTGTSGSSNLDVGTGTLFTGMALSPIPEPSTIALGVLGALVLLFRRRK